MRILSLFDGMACGMIAFKVAGIPIDRYDAYEIDKFAVQVATHNFPEIKEHGDVFKADFTQYEGVDYVIGGSPCTYWSIAQSPDKRETTASGIGWELFSQYVRAIKEAKPKYFIYENNKSMAKAIYDSISATFGFEPIMINSALVSAQNRERYYWVGKRNEYGDYDKVQIDQPKDRGIMLKDILITGDDLTGNDKSYCVTARINGAQAQNTIEKSQKNMVAEPICLNARVNGKQPSICDRIYDPQGKGTAVTSGWHSQIPEPFRVMNYDLESQYIGKTYEVKDGQIEVKGKKYPIKLSDGLYVVRKLSVDECKRLQTVPDWYDMTCISNSQAYKCLGNGWTIEVIAHLIRAAQEGKTEAKQLTFWEV